MRASELTNEMYALKFPIQHATDADVKRVAESNLCKFSNLNSVSRGTNLSLAGSFGDAEPSGFYLNEFI